MFHTQIYLLPPPSDTIKALQMRRDCSPRHRTPIFSNARDYSAVQFDGNAWLSVEVLPVDSSVARKHPYRNGAVPEKNNKCVTMTVEKIIDSVPKLTSSAVGAPSAAAAHRVKKCIAYLNDRHCSFTCLEISTATVRSIPRQSQAFMPPATRMLSRTRVDNSICGTAVQTVVQIVFT